jgi:predicted PurR-regulated permease PerM
MWGHNIKANTVLRISTAIIVLLVLIFLAIKLEDLFFGILIAFLLDHFVEILEDMGINKYIAVSIIVLILVSTIMLILFNLIPVVIKNVVEIFTSITEKIDDPNFKGFEINLFFKTIYYKNFLKSFVILMQKTFHNFSSNDNNSFSSISLIMQKGGVFAKKFSSSISTLLGFSCTIFIVRRVFYNIARKYLSSSMYKILSDLRNSIKIFLLNQFIIALFNFLFFSLVLNFFGVKGWFSVGLASFIGSFVTSFGSLIGIIMTMITVIVQRYHWHSIVIIFAALIIPYMVENYVLIPELICRPLNVNYIAVLISVFGSLELLGVKYILFSVPILIIGKKIISTINFKNKL